MKKIRSAFKRHNIDALLVTNDTNITYLTDFPASESWLFVAPQRSFYITDFRYILEARKGLKGISVKRYTKSMYETLFNLARDAKITRLGIDDQHLTVSQYRILKRHCPRGIKLEAAGNLVESLREIKDKSEIAKVRKALKIHKQSHQFLKRVIGPGMTEKNVLLRLEQFVKSKEAGFSFEPIVASGPNSCYPHAKVTKRRIRHNEPVLIDMGIDVEGYKSDLTRMFFLGKIPNLVRQVNDLVSEAQRKAIENIRDGVSIAEIDFAARNYLAKNKLAKYFGHALGHGVGLDIHERPRLASNNNSNLKEGMIITIEPAVYIPKKFGIRIEDMVLVTKNGCKVLSDDIH